MKVSKAYLNAVLKSRAAGGKKRSVSESTIVSAILKALELKGVWAWRVNSGARLSTYKGKPHLTKLAPAGSPDIFAVLPKKVEATFLNAQFIQLGITGSLCGIEVKTPIGKQSDSQRAWQAKAESFGVRYGIARSVGEALKLVEKWSKSS